eukprot:superscaffoldBa00009181_g23917
MDGPQGPCDRPLSNWSRRQGPQTDHKEHATDHWATGPDHKDHMDHWFIFLLLTVPPPSSNSEKQFPFLTDVEWRVFVFSSLDC